MTKPNSIIDSLQELIGDVGLLIRQEFQLARAEAEEKLDQVQSGLIGVVVGLLIAFCALLVLVQALVVALANVMAPSLAALSVGLGLAVIALAAIKHGETNLRARNLAPSRTLNSLKEQTHRVKESIQ